MDKGYYDKKFAEIPKVVLDDAVEYTLETLSKEDKEQIILLHKKYGQVEWMHALGHFDVGMRLRNYFRECGLTDELLPDKNWDDYYIQVIEKALNLR